MQESKTLIIVIRGWSNASTFLGKENHGGEIPKATLEKISQSLPNAELWVPTIDLPIFSLERPEDTVSALLEDIDHYLELRTDISSIVLVGYSAGSLLARSVFCIAHGADKCGNIVHSPRGWASKIQRLVFLAGITRGWEFSSASPAHIRYLSPVIAGLTQIVSWTKSVVGNSRRRVPFILQLRRGSTFVVTTRIQYLNVIRHLQETRGGEQDIGLTHAGLPTTIFLLGAQDEYMSPADCTELGPRSEFLYAELPGCNHAQALDIEDSSSDGIIRGQRLVAALSEPFTDLTLKEWILPAQDIDDYLDPMDLVLETPEQKVEEDVEHVVIIVHGIRDNGFWTKRVAKELKTLARVEQISLRAPTPSYGYFSMWDFVRPGGKQQATRWFMEKYADVKSHFPNAKISFVGHSNGTYIAGKALSVCHAVKFHRVVLAGSVLRRSFEWDRVSNRVDHVLNYVGSADLVVAFLPDVFEKLQLRFLDVGGAGAFGFDVAKDEQNLSKLQCEFDEVEYIKGAHGAAIGEETWPEIASFVITGNVPEHQTVERKGWIASLFSSAPAITIVFLVVAALLLFAPVAMEVFVGGGIAVFMGLIISWAAIRFIKAW